MSWLLAGLAFAQDAPCPHVHDATAWLVLDDGALQADAKRIVRLDADCGLVAAVDAHVETLEVVDGIVIGDVGRWDLRTLRPLDRRVPVATDRRTGTKASVVDNDLVLWDADGLELDRTSASTLQRADEVQVLGDTIAVRSNRDVRMRFEGTWSDERVEMLFGELFVIGSGQVVGHKTGTWVAVTPGPEQPALARVTRVPGQPTTGVQLRKVPTGVQAWDPATDEDLGPVIPRFTELGLTSADGHVAVTWTDGLLEVWQVADGALLSSAEVARDAVNDATVEASRVDAPAPDRAPAWVDGLAVLRASSPERRLERPMREPREPRPLEIVRPEPLVASELTVVAHMTGRQAEFLREGAGDIPEGVAVEVYSEGLPDWLGPVPEGEALLFDETGTVRARGSIEQVEEALRSVGLEDVDARLPRRLIEPDLRTSERVLELLEDGAIAYRRDVPPEDVVFLERDGSVRWERVDQTWIAGSPLWIRDGLDVLEVDPATGEARAEVTQARAITRTAGVVVMQLADGTVQTLDGVALRASSVFGAERYTVSGLRCRQDLATGDPLGCVPRSTPRVSEPRDAAPWELEDGVLRHEGRRWTLSGVYSVRPLEDGRALVKLGNDEGHWALIRPCGRLVAWVALPSGFHSNEHGVWAPDSGTGGSWVHWL